MSFTCHIWASHVTYDTHMSHMIVNMSHMILTWDSHETSVTFFWGWFVRFLKAFESGNNCFIWFLLMDSFHLRDFFGWFVGFFMSFVPLKLSSEHKTQHPTYSDFWHETPHTSASLRPCCRPGAQRLLSGFFKTSFRAWCASRLAHTAGALWGLLFAFGTHRVHS